MGYADDQWHSSRVIADGLLSKLTGLGLEGTLHCPRLGRHPRWWDRRIRYASTLPRGEILHLIDQSYGDCIVRAKTRFSTVIVTIHDINFWKERTLLNTPWRKRIREGLAAADIRVTDSSFIAEEARRELGLSIERVIPLGAALEELPYHAGTRDPHLLLHVGSADPRKGIDRAIRLLHELPEPYRLLHVGAPLEPHDLDLARALGLESRVSRAPFTDVPRLSSHYQKASALLFPSRYEGFGLPVIESRLTGTCAVVSSHVPSVECLQEDPGTLVLDFEAFDAGGEPARRARAVETFLAFSRDPKNPSNREYLGWERVVKEYAELYREEAARPRAVAR